MMQCKDIDDAVFLRIVAKLGEGNSAHWAFLWDVGDGLKKVYPKLPLNEAQFVGDIYRIVLAKAKGLINRGLMEGCTCGCRGDFTLTFKGEQLIDPRPPSEFVMQVR